MGTLTRSWLIGAIVTAGVVGGGAAPAAQQVSAPALTAAYLFAFVRFTIWPIEVLPEGAAIVVCVEGSDWVADSLIELTKDRDVEGHALSIRRTSLDGAGDGCHVFYAANLHGDRGRRLILETGALPILTVSDSTDFAEAGGVANFYIGEGRKRFAVNPHAAERANLRISSRLLSLARIVGS